jgi:hypothetical protein
MAVSVYKNELTGHWMCNPQGGRNHRHNPDASGWRTWAGAMAEAGQHAQRLRESAARMKAWQTNTAEYHWQSED